MRRLLTALLVGGVVLLALLAAGDALRGHGDGEVSSGAGTTTRTRPPTLRDELRREAVAGLMLYSDEQCLVHSLLLPNLVDEFVREEGTGAPLRRCRFVAGAGRFLADDERVNAAGVHVARCRHGHVEVRDALNHRLVARTPGCMPAWRPDGALTYVRDGQVLIGGRALLSRHDLRRAANRHPNVRGVAPGFPVRVGVTSLAWFDDERLAAALRIKILGVEPQYLLVVFEGRRAAASAVSFSGPFGALIRSPGGSFVADEGGMMMSRSGVATQVAEGLPSGRIVAFSPDERWVALITTGSIYLVATPLNDASIRILRLPFAAADAVWEPGGPTIDTTTTAR
jgi:hypothetical protein